MFRIGAILMAAGLLSGCATLNDLFADIPDQQSAEAPVEQSAEAPAEETTEVQEEQTAAQEVPAPRTAGPKLVNDNAVEDHEQGRLHFQSGRYGLALDAFRRALDQDPGSAKIYNGIAACYDKMRRYDLAERFYREALALDPTAYATLNNLAYSLMMRTEFTRNESYLVQAQELLDRALAAAPNDVIVRGNLQLLAERRGVTPKSIAALPEPRDASAGEGVRILPHDPYVGWIERAGKGKYYLVTQPDPNTADKLRNMHAVPAIVGIEHALPSSSS